MRKAVTVTCWKCVSIGSPVVTISHSSSAPSPDGRGKFFCALRSPEPCLLRRTCNSSSESSGTSRRTRLTIADIRNRTQRWGLVSDLFFCAFNHSIATRSAERRHRCVEVGGQAAEGAVWVLSGRGFLVGRRTVFGYVLVFPGFRFPRSASQTFWNWKEAATTRAFPPLLVAEEMHHAVMISPTHQQRQNPFPHGLPLKVFGATSVYRRATRC
jgi:hypothetical protein